MTHLSIRLLGSFRADLDGNIVENFETQKARALLAYLADEPGKQHTRLALAELLWPELSEQQALNNLRNNLTNLRRAVHIEEACPAFLSIERDTIAFNPLSDSTIDSVEFSRLIERPAGYSPFSSQFLTHLEMAVSLYEGNYLEGFPPLKSSALEEWILSRRAKYCAMQVESLYHLAKASLSRSDFKPAVELARRQLAIEPWREEAYQQLITALALDNQRSQALYEFAIGRDQLTKELGVEPSQVTLRLVESIRDGKLTHQPAFEGFWPSLEPDQAPLSMGSSSVHNLPGPLTRLVGREDVISQLKQILTQQRLVMLTGAGGVGKTRLALALASAMVDQFRDGIWFIELTSLDQTADLSGAVQHALGITPGPALSGQPRLCDYLQSRQMLLILDNCEHIIVPTADLARTLLQSCPQLKILATSREKFGIEGEIDYRVPSLDFPAEDLLPPFENNKQYQAVNLLIERAQAAYPELQVTRENWPAVAYICRRLDGIPLALELAAHHLEMCSPDQLAARLDGSFHFLTRGSRAGLPRHQTLRATIEWSYALLSSAERLLLARLSVFVGGWTLEAAEEVCSGEEIARVDILDLHMRLVNTSMVSIRRQPEGERRFFLLETVRQFAQEKLCQGQQEVLLRERHLAWISATSRKASPGLHSGEHPLWLKKLDADRENLFHALSWAIDQERDLSCGLRILIWIDLWWQRGRDEYRVKKWFQYALTHWTRPGAESDPTYVESLAYLAASETERENAVDLSQRALRMAKELKPEGERAVLATAYFVAGLISTRWEPDAESFLQYMDLAIESLGPIRDHLYPVWALGLILGSKSIAWYHLGDFTRARLLASESMETIRKTGYLWDSRPFWILGKIAQQEGEYAQAREWFSAILAIPPEIEGGWWLSGLRYLAGLELIQGHFPEALRLCQEALRRSREQFGYFLAMELLEDLAYAEILASRNQADEEERLVRAASCWGAVQASRANAELATYFNAPLPGHSNVAAALRERLADSLLEKAWKAGAELNIDQAIRFALDWKF